ncbi:MAG: NAD(P)-dependent oxidoreductase [Paludibacter sp.]
MKILLTGATGFLGSHIAENLNNSKHELLLTKRLNSSLKNCQSFCTNVKWINIDTEEWTKQVISYKPDIIIHAAWNGVFSSNRENWDSQLTNINFIYQLLKIGEKCKVKKFISLGSQAEYGLFEGKITEEYPVNPNSSYGAIKLATYELVKSFCEDTKIDWYWLRIFAIFGERESENWLIPSVISKMLSEIKEMDFTLGEQKYAYLYAADFAQSVSNVVMKYGPSGVYNVSSSNTQSLKDLLQMIRDQINPDFKLNFGILPYRINQSMHIEGDSTKFNNTFGHINSEDFNDKLERVINSYRKQ